MDGLQPWAACTTRSPAVYQQVMAGTLLDLFDADISGRDFPRGKPDPTIFLTAAAELGRPPAGCYVVEDAATGIHAAKAAGMAALGVARLGDEELLVNAGADLVVTTLDDVSLDALAEGRLRERRAATERRRRFEGRPPSVWSLTYEGFEPKRQGLREALCALGNGYFVTRAALPEARADRVNYPGTYVAGLYHGLQTDIAGRTVENETWSGRWLPDHSHLQRHVNIAVAYNVWQHFMVTGSMQFLRFTGAEMLLEIARFWASAATFNAELDRYEILGVMGPDGYHDAYPGAERPGLDNNTYTNVMAVWTLLRAMEALDVLPPHYRAEIVEELQLRPDELDRWRDIARKMKVVFHADGVLTQFEGYEQLQEFDWEGYRTRYGDIHRLDRLLEAEGDTPN